MLFYLLHTHTHIYIISMYMYIYIYCVCVYIHQLILVGYLGISTFQAYEIFRF